MLTYWYQDLASHVTALLCPRRLILNVNSGSTVLNEELGQFHDGGKPAVTGVSVGNDRSKKICIGKIAAVGFWRSNTLFSLFAIMEELG